MASSEVHLPVLIMPPPATLTSTEPYQYLFHADHTPQAGSVDDLQADVLRQAESLPLHLLPRSLGETYAAEIWQVHRLTGDNLELR